MMPDLELKPQQKVLALLASSERIIVEDGYFNVEFITAELESPSTGDNERLEESMHFMFGKWYNTDEFSLDYAEANRRLLESIIEYCLRQEWQPVLVTIPISQVLEDGLAEDYKQVYLYDQVAKTDLKGAKYYDFSSKPTPKSNSDFFSNSDHLNADGAALFSYLLLRQLINEKMLPESADGYTYPKTSSSGETVDYLQIVDQYLP